MKFDKSIPIKPTSFLIAGSISWVVLIYSSFGPMWSGDSTGYVTPGCHILSLRDIRLYDGARTPVYPLMLGILQYLFSGKCLHNPDHSIVDLITFIQVVIYIGSIFFLYYSVKKYNIIMTIAVFLISMSPAPILFTRFILTESVTISFINIFLGFLLRFNSNQELKVNQIFAICFLSLAVLTRANLLIPSIPILIFILIRSENIKTTISYLTILFIIPLLMLAFLNFLNRGYFKIVNFDGFSKTHIVYNIFDRVKPEDWIIGEILNQQHLKDIKSGDETAMVVWRAIAEIRNNIEFMPFSKKDATSAESSDLNEYLNKVSTYLIINNPHEVLKNLSRSLKLFWVIKPIEIPYISKDPHVLDGGPNIRNQFIYKNFLRLQAVYNIHAQMVMVLLPFLLIIIILTGKADKIFFSGLIYFAYLANYFMVSLFNVIELRYLIVMQQLIIAGFYYALSQLYSNYRINISATHKAFC